MPNKSHNRKKASILWFNEISNKDAQLVGGKNASLGEMYQHLVKHGVRIPNGFAITAYAYQTFIKHNDLEKRMRHVLRGSAARNIKLLAKKGSSIRRMILDGEFPEDLKEAIINAYQELSLTTPKKLLAADVAVRSSATAEDLPDASFAGQQETYLNVRSIDELLDSTKRAFASLFTNRAISYREDNGFQHFQVSLSVGVQLMVRSDKGSSGVMFTLDTESGFRDVVLINSIYGLGENIVQGNVSPDEFLVFKPTLKKHYPAIISKTLGSKRLRMVYDNKQRTRNTPVSEKDQLRFSLSDEHVLRLAKWAIIIEDHYKMPMDIEWAHDGVSDTLYVVQARPETVRSQEDPNVLEEYRLLNPSPRILVNGTSVGKKIGHGPSRVILDVKHINEFKPGEILVTSITNPDWEPIMKKAAAIVTDSGGRTAHAAIVSRELGIPAIVGSALGTKLIPNGKKITVDCSQGEIGYVYDGFVKYDVKRTNITKIPKLSTEIMMNIGEPSQAFLHSQIPNDGVGLARLEFIINEYIKIHPLALLSPDEVTRPRVKKIIRNRVRRSGYEDGVQFFIDRLTEGIARIGAAFYPRDVIVRLSDFKTNEYRHLIGGGDFEPIEQNPMLGWRGASRYYDKRFRPAFDLECAAFIQARETFGLSNIKIMVPFVRTIEEGKQVLAVLKQNGLERGKKKLEIYMMVEVPSNIILADQFARMFDGFSIGSNDLTQLTLGVDRDSQLVSHIYDERNEAVKTQIRYVISVAKKAGIKIGICGQAPSDLPDFATFLVKEGIDSLSLNPDTVLPTRLRLAKLKTRKKHS